MSTSYSAKGRQAWRTDRIVAFVIAAAKSKTIVYTTFFSEPQTGRGLVLVRKIKQALAISMFPAMLLVIGHLVFTAMRLLVTEAGTAKSHEAR